MIACAATTALLRYGGTAAALRQYRSEEAEGVQRQRRRGTQQQRQ